MGYLLYMYTATKYFKEVEIQNVRAAETNKSQRQWKHGSNTNKSYPAVT